ncbi:MAG TPA: DUF4232 domain-containing protein [Friedmanniella sp.]
MNRSRTTLRAQTLAVLTCGLAATTTLLTGCGNGVQSTAPGSGPVIAAPTATPSAHPSTGPSTQASAGARATEVHGSATASDTSSTTSTRSTSSAPGTATPSSRRDRCTTAHLQVGVRTSQGGPGAGSDYVLLTYRNAGTSGCVLTGYPGVSFVGHGDGSQLGDPATRSAATSSRPVRLAAGATTTSLLQIANAGNYDPATCVPITADGLRVYPPGSTTAVFVAFRTQACQRATGSSSQLVASPVGTNG